MSHSHKSVCKYLSILLILVASSLTTSAQNKPANPVRTGFTATSEGGVEGTQTIQYDENGKMVEGQTRGPANVISRPSPSSRPTVSSPVISTTAPSVSQGMTSNDGRKIPFTLSGGAGSKQVDSTVDVDSALKNSSKTSNILEKKFETNMAELNSNSPYSRENIITFDTWHGKYDIWGRKKAEIEVTDTFERGELKDKNLVEVKSIERKTSDWTGKVAAIAGLDQTLTTEKNSRYDVTPLQPSERTAPKSIDQLSMQDINRYQFRRNRSDAPGLPVVKPGAEGVQIKGGAQ